MMKLVIDERVKHRLIGLAVILSIAAIFAPAIMKKSNQRFDNNVNVSVELPPKPAQPNVAVTEKKAMFETVKIAHVEIPEEDNGKSLTELTKVDSVQAMDENEAAAVKGKAELSGALTLAQIKPTTLKNNKPVSLSAAKVAAIRKVARAEIAPAVKPKIVAGKANPLTPSANQGARSVIKKGPGYGVQIATFSKQQNADSLISKLRAKGYKATYNKVTTRTGALYKVIVGTGDKRQAEILKEKLATAMQLKGFIVVTGQG